MKAFGNLVTALLILLLSIGYFLERSENIKLKQLNKSYAADESFYVKDGCIKNDQTGFNFCCPGWEFKEGSN